MITNAAVLQNVTPDNVRMSLSRSRNSAPICCVGDQIAIDSPISSGKRGHATPTGSFHHPGKGQGPSLEPLRRLQRLQGPHRPRRHQRADRFGPERHAFRRGADEMVHAPDRRRRRHARRDSAGLSRIPWLHPHAGASRRALFFEGEGRNAGRRRAVEPLTSRLNRSSRSPQHFQGGLRRQFFERRPVVWEIENCLTCVAAPSAASAMKTVPTGFSSVPPPGPGNSGRGQGEGRVRLAAARLPPSLAPPPR